ncbi:MAG: hypothetical protein IE889_00355 [Campylobacterales bacterium]|nr:hypothetical protein [Campylobacterales bacterium]
MRKNFLIPLSVLSLMLVGCGTNIDEATDEPYDMWNYMTPDVSYEVTYDVYENGNKVDYLVETTNVLDIDRVVRESGQDIISMTRYENTLQIEKSNEAPITVQRFVKVGDQDVFQSTAIDYCDVENFYRSTLIKGVEFYNVLEVYCQTDSSKTTFYYGYNEGIVAFYREEGDKRVEQLKVEENRL